MDIGQKIKELRLKNGLTLEELASRCELTKGFLSQLERDLTSPSIATLSDILEALGVNMSDFFLQEKTEKTIFSKDDFFVDEQEDYKITWVIPNAQKNSMEPILIEIDPNKQSMIVEPHEGQEFGYVMSGRIEIVYEDRQEQVKQGETFYLFGDKEHYLLNKTSKKACVLWVTNPPIF